MTQITELTFQEIINSLQSGEISSHQLTKAYLKRIEELTKTPIDIISTGPDRDETIILNHPFE